MPAAAIDASRKQPFCFWLAQDPNSADPEKRVAGPFLYDGNRVSEVDGSRPAYLSKLKYALPPQELHSWIRTLPHGGSYWTGENPWREAVMVECLLKPGQRYARIARPWSYLSESRTPDLPKETTYELHRSASQLFALCERLSTLFQYVHPDEVNFQSYGLEARNIIVLAATEVEVQFRAVCAANGLRVERPRMNDFVKLHGPMLLDAYATQFSQCPWVAPIAPFADWDVERPGQSLDWYGAYNSVKHDRETNLARSTLLAAMRTVSACHVMLMAQFGEDRLHRARPDLGIHLSGRLTGKRYPLGEENSRGIYITPGWPAAVETIQLFGTHADV